MDLIKKVFFVVTGFIGLSVVNPLKCVSLNNQEYRVIPVIMNINSNETLFYPYSILVNKCSGSCIDINHFYAQSCVLDVVKNINIKVFNQIWRTNETRYVSWHVTVGYMQVFVIINSVGVMINADLNANNLLRKVFVMMDLFGILVNVNVIVINNEILDNI